MNILITGASKGIGFELAKLFAQNEENLVLGLSRNEKLLKNLKNECIKVNLKTKFKPIVFDLEDAKAIQKDLKSEIEQHCEKLDIVINNAGYLVNKPFDQISIEDINRTMNINLSAPTLLIQSLLPLIKKSNLKHVVNISSMGGFQGSAKFPGLSIYSASKAALSTLTECLAEEYKQDEIKFNCLALGAVNTEMLQSAFPEYKAPLEAHEMAQYIYDFAVKSSNYINGKVIPVSITTP